MNKAAANSAEEDIESVPVSKIPVGVSSCLLGERVRYDGGHKGHSYITRTLGEYFEFYPFCPELNIGLGIPRKPIRLARSASKDVICVEINDPEKEYTDKLRDCANEQQAWHSKLCGYILKKDSPSCGMERVKIWDKAMPVREGVGIYAQQMMQNFPYLPVEEEGRMGDAVLRENFIQRVFVMRRWYRLQEEGLTIAALIDFHARHKLIIMSHDQNRYRELGRFVAGITKDTLHENSGQYLLQLMEALKIRATRKNHVNVLQHIQGYLKNYLDKDDKEELRQTIENYRIGQLPLIVPITLLNHFFRKHPDEYIANSWYMNPYPAELCLQNTI
ncbi:MAG: DUF523 and DUF1722 domain-containing protein [Proteobacteria bacterium]|nr:DUF523 and DUF1722 domain-containing protein [Pseudomonadota bacterium]MDA0928810.1 DUF523 and DUF1722 domain-containing protein [Pseudomonadota bacterium]